MIFEIIRNHFVFFEIGKSECFIFDKDFEFVVNIYKEEKTILPFSMKNLLI